MRTLGYLFWLAMLVLSLVFYRERAIFMDGAFQLFEIINDGQFKIYHYRLPNPLTQVLPLLAVHLELPLRWVLLLYSANFILLFAGIYHLLTGWLKNDALGWALIFFFSLITLDSFFFLPPELYQGNALALLTFGIVLKFPELHTPVNLDAKFKLPPKFSPTYVPPLVAVLTLVVVFSHKLALVSWLFLWLFFGLSDARLRHKRYLLLLAWALVLAVVHSLFFMDWYDAAKQEEFKHWFGEYFPNFHRLPAHGIFWENCIKHYYFFPLLLTLVLGFYAWKRQGWKLAVVACFSVGYILLLHIGSPDTPIRFYAEASYLPLTVFVSVPLLIDLVPGIGRRRVWLWLFAGILLIRLNVVTNNAKQFERRLDWYAAQLEQCAPLGSNRLLLKNSLAPQDLLLMDWATPHETLLLSALEHPDSAKTLFIYPTSEPDRANTAGDDIFLSIFKQMDAKDLNRRYFNLQKGKYVEIK